MSKKSKGSGKRYLTVKLKKSRGRSVSSQRWLQRQLNDPYTQEAQRLGYRSRAAFKLSHINEKYNILKPDMRVVDLGAAPGGWCQILTEYIDTSKPGNEIIAIDILEMEPMPGVVSLQLDFENHDAPEILKSKMSGPADLVLSDMAPPTTGHKNTDHLRIMSLVEMAYDFAEQILAPGGVFIAKVFQGGTEQEILKKLKQHFDKVHHFKPESSRKDSSEMFVVAIGFKKKAS
jgi:23S rRNA (uridine2552-2'-O)-methyltransferase